MAKNNLKIRLIKNKNDLDRVLRIRKIVFIKEQKVPEELEIDGLDKMAKHVIVLYKNKVIGCTRIRFIGKKAKLERISLLKHCRGKGFGKFLMEFLINYCKNNKAKTIVMNAQFYLKDYYSRFGFKPKGKSFMEAGIKHIEMYL